MTDANDDDAGDADDASRVAALPLPMRVVATSLSGDDARVVASQPADEAASSSELLDVTVLCFGRLSSAAGTTLSCSIARCLSSA